MDKKFYICPICGNIVEKIEDSGNELVCCGRTMQELVPNVTDGNNEYHVPVCEKHSNYLIVKVGKENHPMTADHYIQWIELVTNKGVQRVYLKPDHKPTACFELRCDEQICAVYAYCNKHKLWVCKC